MSKPGKQFEADCQKSVDKKHFMYRLRDAGSNIGGQNPNLRFQVKNICDFIMFHTEKMQLILLEMKSTKNTSVPFTMIDSEKKDPSKRYKNLKKMVEHSKKNNVKAYVIFNMRKTNETYAVSAETVLDYVIYAERKSIPIDFMKSCGIRVPQKQLRVNWRYDLDVLVEGD